MRWNSSPVSAVSLAATGRLIGRNEELHRLVGLLMAAPGEGRFVAMSGQPGIGKTRLMSEIARMAGAGGRQVLWSQMTEDPAAPPYFAWVLALREYIDDCDDVSLREDLGSGALDLADLLPELRDRFDLPPANHSARGDAARYRLFDSLTRFLLAAGKRRPLLLLFDNLHLVDASSLAMLEHYALHLRNSSTVVLAAYRDPSLSNIVALKSMLARLSRTVSFENLPLVGLDRDGVGELLRERVAHALAPGLIDGIHEHSDGNPLFVNEIAGMLAGRADPKGSALARCVFRVPDTLHEVINARLEALPQACRRMVGIAAVLGREFEAAAVAAVARCSITTVLSTLERGVREGVISPAGPTRFRFHHALFREVLYGAHNTLRRAALHRRAAEYLETKSSGDVTARLSQLAFHFFEAAQLDQAERAVHHCIRAGEVALQQRAFSEAAVQFERAIHAMEMVSEPEPSRQHELLMKHAEAQYRSGQAEAASETQLNAALLANHHQRWPWLAESLIAFQRVRAALGVGHVAAVPLHREALAHLPEEQLPIRARLLGSLSVALKQAGQASQALDTARQGIELARSSDDPIILADCLLIGDWAFCGSHYVEERVTLAQEALHLTGDLHDPGATMEALRALVFSLCELGRLDQARNCLVRLKKMAEAERHPHYLNVAIGVEAAFALMRGHWDEAYRCATESRRNVVRQDVVGLEGRFGFQMFAIHRARGLLAEVSGVFDHIVGTAQRSRLWLPGQILLHCELGQRVPALAALERLDDPGRLPRDDLFLTVLVYLAEACAWLGDRPRCARIHELLAPYRGLNASLHGTVIHGAVAGFMAPLAVVNHRPQEARELFEEALALDGAMGATLAVVRDQAGLAGLLCGAESTADQGRARKLLAEARETSTALGLGPMLERIKLIEQANSGHGHLTPREIDVLRLIADGASNKAIAGALFISQSTVATHVRNILRKTAAANRTEAAAYARRERLVDG